jgi:hypothetical protein
MLDLQAHVRAQALNNELREIALLRPRLDRPEYRRRSRLRAFFEAVAHAPAKAVLEPGKPVPGITIRTARATDSVALSRLAEISERRVPSGLVLVAEVESDIVAALPVAGGPLLSDLWRPTSDAVQLLELRSGQIKTVQSTRAA